MPAEVLHELPMRWADLDSLNHVNNVVYLDYAAESRATLCDEGVVGPDERVTSIAVRFVRPLFLTRAPVVVASVVDGDVLDQQVCLERDGRRTVFAEVVTRFGDREPAPARVDLPTSPMQVRRGDVDVTGSVRLPRVFELFQEARVLTISSYLPSGPGMFVIGSSEVTYRSPVPWRAEPYATTAWVSRIGRASFEMRAELTDGASVLANSTTVLVGFDQAAQSSRAFSDEERDQLATLVPLG